MSNGFKIFAAAIVLLTALLSHAETLHGRVVAVADGDTLTLLRDGSQQERIRLAGIDSPEKHQDFGQVAKANLSDLSFGREAAAECRKRDRYRRQVCVVTVDGVDIGLAQVKAGMAWWYRQYISDQTPAERNAYEQAEKIARSSRLGLWRQPSPVPPWDFRRGQHLSE